LQVAQNSKKKNSEVFRPTIIIKMNKPHYIGDPWRMKEFSTDEFIVPGRASGGWYDQANVDLTNHKQDADNKTIARAWVNIFQEIGTANAVMESLQASPNKDKLKALIAETRALRAYGYFFAMDN
jgi:hypothetical protein